MCLRVSLSAPVYVFLWLYVYVYFSVSASACIYIYTHVSVCVCVCARALSVIYLREWNVRGGAEKSFLSDQERKKNRIFRVQFNASFSEVG